MQITIDTKDADEVRALIRMLQSIAVERQEAAKEESPASFFSTIIEEEPAPQPKKQEIFDVNQLLKY